MSQGDVLVVDDTVANLEVVSQVLEDAGYEVAMALSGDRALKLINSHPPDLVLLDIQMPGIDGFETCRQLKNNPKTAGIPVIFMTALSDTTNKVRGFEIGAVDYITKPFQEQELLARVRTHVQMRQWGQLLESKVTKRTEKLQSTLEKLSQSQLQLVHSEKMSALGSTMAGVAHEINNPLGFLDGSLNNAQCHVQELLDHISLYQEHFPQPPAAIQENEEDIKFDFLSEDLLKLLTSMKVATRRIKEISASLRIFSRADTEHAVQANIHEGIDSTLLILKHRLKGNEHRPRIQIVKAYSNLPKIECYLGQLNQVFMNILANGIDMFDEMASQATYQYFETNPQILTISTRLGDRNTVEIRIRDNGVGMDETVKQRLFERMFTTKAVGKGTGLGLAIAHQIVVDHHGGQLTVYSEPGEGSEFLIQIPVQR